VLLQITIKKTSEIYLFKLLILLCYFEADDVKKHTLKNIVPVIDKGVFHNYVHMCKQLFCVTQSEAVADDRHLFCKFLTFL